MARHTRGLIRPDWRISTSVARLLLRGQRRVAEAARGLAVATTTIFMIYGDESGLIYEGWGGGRAPVKGGGKVPSGPGWKCYPLKPATTVIPIISPVPVPPIVREKKISWGPANGKSCKDATAADILACLRGKPRPTGEPGIVQNCQTDCFEAAEGCCLTGFMPATILPPPRLLLIVAHVHSTRHPRSGVCVASPSAGR